MELDNRHAIARENTVICAYISSVRKWYALASAGRMEEALAMPGCLVLDRGDKVLIVERDMAGYTRGIWTAPDGSAIDVWMLAYPNMTEWDFAVFDCNDHRPSCTFEVYEALKHVMPPDYKWRPLN